MFLFQILGVVVSIAVMAGAITGIVFTIREMRSLANQSLINQTSNLTKRIGLGFAVFLMILVVIIALIAFIAFITGSGQPGMYRRRRF